MATERCRRRGLSPPAKRESAANPVIVPQTHRHANTRYDCLWLKWVDHGQRSAGQGKTKQHLVARHIRSEHMPHRETANSVEDSR